MTTIVEFFDFLPYGKYAFYVWATYFSAILIVGILFFKTWTIHKKTLAMLKIKYRRES